MMMFLFLLLLSVALAALTLLVLVVRASNKRRLLAEAHGIAGEATDGIGISVLCTSEGDIAQIENLLSVEYTHYEVVVVIDAQRHPAEVEQLVARYRMIGVAWSPSGELQVEGVRALGRSRKRCYRRLVLIDRAYDTPEGDFDAATVVASYDFVLPLRADQYLLPDAVTRLVAEVGEYALGALMLVRSCIGEPALLLSREAVVAAGGFSHHPVRHIPRCERKMLWEPLLYAPHKKLRCLAFGWRLTAALLLAAVCLIAAWMEVWAMAAVLLTAALVWSVAEYVTQMLGPRNLFCR